MRSTLPIWELQEKLIYSAIVAGKSAKFTDAVMQRLYNYWGGDVLPFQALKRLKDEGQLFPNLQLCRTGNYHKLARCFGEMAEAVIDLAECTPQELEKIHGIGQKTSRFFIIWTREGEQYAALDVHVLRWLREKGHDAPAATPSNPAEYDRLQTIFLEEAKASGKDPRALDFEIWGKGSGYTGDIQSE